MDKQLKIVVLKELLENGPPEGKNKLEVINFIKEAEDTQVEAFLITRKMLNKEESNRIVEDFVSGFQSTIAGSGIPLGQTGAVIAGMAGLAAAILLIKVGSKVYYDYVHKLHKQCREYKGDARQICTWKVAMMGRKKKIQVLSKAAVRCSKTKDRKKCVDKIASKIRDEKQEVRDLQSSIKDLQKTMKMKGKPAPSF